jgi:hypothetical protein
MNDLNEDYLWDRTGEPDPEIKKLEEILGTLRYQPRPLEIPAGVEPRNQRFPFSGLRLAPQLAVAAAITALALGLGLWVIMQRQAVPELAKTEGTPVTNTQSTQTAVAPSKANDSSPALAPERDEKSQRHRTHSRVNPAMANRSVIAANTNRNRRQSTDDSNLAASERKEAEAGKQQLMLALRLASSKLNFAQKKTNGASPENQIHNQHKIG